MSQPTVYGLEVQPTSQQNGPTHCVVFKVKATSQQNGLAHSIVTKGSGHHSMQNGPTQSNVLQAQTINEPEPRPGSP